MTRLCRQLASSQLRLDLRTLLKCHHAVYLPVLPPGRRKACTQLPASSCPAPGSQYFTSLVWNGGELNICMRMCSAWLVHSNNPRGFVVKLSEMGLPDSQAEALPIASVPHAAPELLTQASTA